jgi:hypothetical protein
MMIKILIAAALVAGTVSSADAALSWIKANGVCAGGYENCASKEECTYTGVGPCTADEKEPKWHLASTFVGLAFVSDGYTTDFANKAKVIEPKPGAQGFRKAEAGQTNAGIDTEYAYAMAATMFGSSDKAYGYAGLASYLNTGTKDISVNQNTFYGFSDYNTDFSTPTEYDICIAPMTGTTCGPKVTFKPGAYKFSLFGNNLGADWKTSIAGLSNKIKMATSTKVHMGFRMQVQAKGIAFDNVTLNGGTDIANIGETDVTSIVIANADTELKYTFPKNFNYGKASTIQAEGDAGLKTGAIKVVVSLEQDTLIIDYLFPMDKVGTDGDQYFVYDPEITAGKAGTTGVPAGAAAAATSAAAAAVATATAFLAM